MPPTTRRRDPYSRILARVPERTLAAAILHLAEPLLGPLGDAPAPEDLRRVVELTVTVWNALVSAGPYWQRPASLNKLQRAANARRGDPVLREALPELTARFRALREFDPRRVREWFFVANATGEQELVCEPELPAGVEVELPPPPEKRMAIAGRFLDDVRIKLDASTYRSFPIQNHQGVVAPDGVATIRTDIALALALFAEGVLPPVGGAPVDVRVGTRDLGPMVLRAARVVDEMSGFPKAVLVFGPSEEGPSGARGQPSGS